MERTLRRVIYIALAVLAAFTLWRLLSSLKTSEVSKHTVRYAGVAQDFARAILEKNDSKAYALTSSQLQKRLSEQAFHETWEKARQTYGQAVRIDVTDNGQYVLDDEDRQGFAAGLSQEVLNGWYVAEFALELDEQGEVGRCFDTWLVFIEENNQPKIVHFYHDWCD